MDERSIDVLVVVASEVETAHQSASSSINVKSKRKHVNSRIEVTASDDVDTELDSSLLVDTTTDNAMTLD